MTNRRQLILNKQKGMKRLRMFVRLLILFVVGFGVYSFSHYKPKVETVQPTSTPAVQVATPIPSPSTPSVVSTKSVKAKYDNIITLVNQKRAEKNLKPVIFDVKVASGAYNRAGSLYASNQWSHDGLAQAFWDAGLRDWYVENLARGFATDGEVINSWMASPSHAANILDERCTVAGVGRVGNYVVLWMGICGQPR